MLLKKKIFLTILLSRIFVLSAQDSLRLGEDDDDDIYITNTELVDAIYKAKERN